MLQNALHFPEYSKVLQDIASWIRIFQDISEYYEVLKNIFVTSGYFKYYIIFYIL